MYMCGFIELENNFQFTNRQPEKKRGAKNFILFDYFCGSFEVF